MQLCTPASPATNIPVIDLHGAVSVDAGRRKPVATATHHACRDIGFFYISGHGVPPDLIQAQFKVAKAFFELPPSDQQRWSKRNSRSEAGYGGIGAAVLDSQNGSQERPPGELQEGCYIGSELPHDHPHVVRKLRGFGHNQWPLTPVEYRVQSLAYHAAMRELGNRILSLLAESLKLSPDWFQQSFTNSTAALQMPRYPPRPTVEDNQLGASALTDWSALAILAQDDVRGLEVRNVAGHWIKAPPKADTFVINLGDLMVWWTNGIYSFIPAPSEKATGNPAVLRRVLTKLIKGGELIARNVAESREATSRYVAGALSLDAIRAGWPDYEYRIKLRPADAQPHGQARQVVAHQGPGKRRRTHLSRCTANGLPSNACGRWTRRASRSRPEANATTIDNIPIIDISSWAEGDSSRRDSIAQPFGDACERWGFLIVGRHDMPPALIEEIKTVTR